MSSSSKLHYFAIAIILVFNITLVLTYTIAVSHDHILPFFSYISDTGNFPPEACVFGLGLSIASFLLLVCYYIRYYQVDSFLDQNSHQKFPSRARFWNKVGLIFGVGSSLGVCVCGTFQLTSQLVVHVIGAMLAFGWGSVYLIVQTYISKIMVAQVGSTRLVYLRIFLSLSCAVLFVATAVTGGWSWMSFTGESIFKWKPHHGGFELRVVSVFCEWVLMALFQIYLLTFVPEFKRISFEPPKFRFGKDSTEDGENGRNPSLELKSSAVLNV